MRHGAQAKFRNVWHDSGGNALARTIVGLCIFWTLASPASGKEAPYDHEAIVVTARRTAEPLREVPIHVSVVPSSEITQGGVVDLQSLASRIPGLSFEGYAGGGAPLGATTPILRGQSQPSVAGDAVAIFVDGVNQANRDAIDILQLDLERIEVLHGPQSALFGHSSFAGVIHFVPARPSETPAASFVADWGTDGLFGIRGMATGPIDATFKGRLAAAWGRASGTWKNTADPDGRLGDMRKLAVAGTVSTRDLGAPLTMRLSGRYGESRSGHPALFTLGPGQYGCGARNPASGLWSSACGKVPIPGDLALSPEVPGNMTRGGQASLSLTLDLGNAELRSETSYYHMAVRAFRDSDGHVGGEIFGVCDVDLNCTGPGSLTIPVIRFQSSNRVARTSRRIREFTQELRLASSGDRRLAWQIGGVVYWTHIGNLTAIGSERGALAANERFTSLLPGNPQQVGPIAFVNSAVVDDPNISQVTLSDLTENHRAIALFGTAELRLLSGLRLRAEARANWERLTLESRVANFLPSFGKTLGARHFFDFTPRLSLDWQPGEDWLAYASYARGSRSGGINPYPNLLPGEQTFRPETNWTAELGLKYSRPGIVRSFQATGYHIDWRNTQILGISATPGFGALIMQNTRGIETWGFELAAQLAPANWLSLDLAYGYAHPRFKRGSEDPASGAFCGYLSQSSNSNICRIVASEILPGQLVPDISGKIPARAVGVNWATGLTASPKSGPLAGFRLSLDVSHQGDVYERQINSDHYGARTLLNARISIPLGAIAVDVWGTNLTNERYVLISPGGRPPQLYLGQPRPADFVLADRRRLGMSLRYPR